MTAWFALSLLHIWSAYSSSDCNALEDESSLLHVKTSKSLSPQQEKIDGVEEVNSQESNLQELPSHFYAVTSWDAETWGAWNHIARDSLIEKCLPRHLTTDPDGSGIMATSCCNIADGIGMIRDCTVTNNTHFLEAALHCESRGGRLCSADEVISGTTVGKGCSVDGPELAIGANLNRVWTNTPCNVSTVSTAFAQIEERATAWPTSPTWPTLPTSQFITGRFNFASFFGISVKCFGCSSATEYSSDNGM